MTNVHAFPLPATAAPPLRHKEAVALKAGAIVFICKAEVLQRTGLSNSALYAAIADGRFPRQVKTSPRKAAWVESEVVHWQEQRILERNRN